MSINTTTFYFFIGAFLVSFILIPKIRTIAKHSNFNSIPNFRSSHNEAIPNIGGVAFYVSLLLSFYFIFPFDKDGFIRNLIPGLTILFIIGLKDDLVAVASSTKLIAQVAAGFFLVLNPSFQILNLNGFLWVFQNNYFFAFALSIFIIVVIINAINLIDGIDGLAGVISIIAFSSFAIVFYITKEFSLFFISIVTIGSIFGFLRFNISKSTKIFMGDTGSMILGFLLAVLTIRLFTISTNNQDLNFISKENIPYLVFSFLSIPIMDTIRVFSIRVLNGKSPFKADRNHIHHIVLDYFQLSHFKTSLLIGLYHIFIVVLFSTSVYFLSQVYLLLLTCLVMLVTILVINFFVKKNKKNKV
jgi:UDP-N-acetylmuramyl pentapeptide phosphotransferase/UDP-N-acetylglucosamine-1-phosphate transferase